MGFSPATITHIIVICSSWTSGGIRSLLPSKISSASEFVSRPRDGKPTVVRWDNKRFDRDPVFLGEFHNAREKPFFVTREHVLEALLVFLHFDGNDDHLGIALVSLFQVRP